jgi:DNA-directed RNA polymerase II subunit RPB2
VNYVKIFINGDWIGVVKISNAFDIFNMLKQKRRENIIEKQTSISLDTSIKELKIYFDGGRLIRPVLVVNNNKVNITENVIKDINEMVSQKDKSKAWKEVISKYSNLVDYEDIESLNYLMVSDSVDKLELQIKAKESKVEYTDETHINRYGDYRWVNYTHCDFHAWVMLGSVVGNIPFSNHNYGLRNIIHFSQAKQSISLYLSSYKDRMDISQVLWHPQVPLVQTQGMQYNNCLDLPHGENAVVAVCSYTGLNH